MPRRVPDGKLEKLERNYVQNIYHAPVFNFNIGAGADVDTIKAIMEAAKKMTCVLFPRKIGYFLSNYRCKTAGECFVAVAFLFSVFFAPACLPHIRNKVS